MRRHECHLCGRVFNKKSNIVCHMRTHTGEKPFPCAWCGSKFTHKSTLMQHSMLHTGEKPHQCEVCCKRFRQLSHYTLHRKIHSRDTRSFECIVCGKYFAQRVHLTTHSRLHTGEKPFACRECDKTFFQRCHLTRHQKVHIGEKLLENSGYDRLSCGDGFDAHTRPNTPEKSHILSKSSHDFVQKGALVKHDVMIDVSNLNPGIVKRQVMFECDVCNRKFLKKSNLRRHILVHTGEKPFECNECGKKYSERRSVARHIERVHNELHLVGQSRLLLVKKAIERDCGGSFTGELSLEDREAKGTAILTPKENAMPGTEEEDISNSDSTSAMTSNSTLSDFDANRKLPSRTSLRNKTTVTNPISQKPFEITSINALEGHRPEPQIIKHRHGKLSASDVTSGHQGETIEHQERQKLLSQTSGTRITHFTMRQIDNLVYTVEDNKELIDLKHQFDDLKRAMITDQQLLRLRPEKPIGVEHCLNDFEDKNFLPIQQIPDDRIQLYYTTVVCNDSCIPPREPQTLNRQASMGESTGSQTGGSPSGQETCVCLGCSHMSVGTYTHVDQRPECDLDLKQEIEIVEEHLDEHAWSMTDHT